jgi:hypothetical protein
MVETDDFKAKAVGAEVDGGKARSVLHGWELAVFGSIAPAGRAFAFRGCDRAQNTSGTISSGGTGRRV